MFIVTMNKKGQALAILALELNKYIHIFMLEKELKGRQEAVKELLKKVDEFVHLAELYAREEIITNREVLKQKFQMLIKGDDLKDEM